MDLGHFARCLRSGEVRVVALESRPAREDVVWKLANESVVGLKRIVIALTLNRDAILGPASSSCNRKKFSFDRNCG